MDGVNSMTGNAPDVSTFARLAREYDALLYVDDAHGFGVVGERTPDELSPYGTRGNGIVRHLDETYDGIVMVGGFSKAYSSLLAFLALPSRLKDVLKVAAPPYLYSGPSPVASLATAWAGLDVNERRGDVARADVHRRTAMVLHTLRELGIHTPNRSGYPIVEIPLARPDDIDDAGRYLFDRGIYVTLAARPLVPKDEVGFRIQVTAANTDEQVVDLCDVLADLERRFELRSEQFDPERAAG
jgi:7-keto-8-aminopelargonate synthetase-like enzyme